MATMKTSGKKLIKGFVCALGAACCKRKKPKYCIYCPARDARRYSGYFPINIDCLISLMMSRYRVRLCSVASVENVISPA